MRGKLGVRFLSICALMMHAARSAHGTAASKVMMATKHAGRAPVRDRVLALRAYEKPSVV